MELSDFYSLAFCLDQIDGLGFYNSGPEAGASQPHRHLQLIPSSPLNFPLYYLLKETALSGGEKLRVEDFRFVHLLFSFRSAQNIEQLAKSLFRFYLESVELLGLRVENSPFLKPYNLIVTRELFFIVARRREFFRTISVNSLGFVGDFLCQNSEELELLRSMEPLDVLAEVSRSEG